MTREKALAGQTADAMGISSSSIRLGRRTLKPETKYSYIDRLDSMHGTKEIKRDTYGHELRRQHRVAEEHFRPQGLELGWSLPTQPFDLSPFALVCIHGRGRARTLLNPIFEVLLGDRERADRSQVTGHHDAQGVKERSRTVTGKVDFGEIMVLYGNCLFLSPLQACPLDSVGVCRIAGWRPFS